jgi:hypothetical protein
MNGDGYQDVVIGAQVGADEGRAYVYSGVDGSLLHALAGEGNGHFFGSAVDGGRDVSGDGIPDFIVGAKDAGASARGRAYLYSGRKARLLYRFKGEVPQGEFGNRLRLLGDVDGDGINDMVVGDPYADGKAYVSAGNDLFLEARPANVDPGEDLTLYIRGGEPFHF